MSEKEAINVQIGDLSEADPLIPDDEEESSEGIMPFYSAVFNLTHTIIGSGTLTLPFVFANSGWVPGNIIGVLIVIFTAYSTYMLVVASDRVGGHGARNFEGLGYLTCGVAGSVYAECTFIFGGFGTLTGYLIFIGKLMCQVTGLDTDNDRWIPILISVGGIILPLTVFRKIHFLRYVSVTAVLAIVYIAVMYVIFVARIGKYDDDPTGSFTYENTTVAVWNSDTISSINLMIGAFCVQNTCLPIYGELKNRTPRRMIAATLCAMAISAVVYEIVGACGYLLMGGNVDGDSLLDFDDNFVKAHPWTDVPRNVAKVMMSANLALVAPLAIWPFRSAVCSVVHRARNGCTGPARGSDFASATLFRTVTIVALACISFLAILLPNVTVVLSVVNSLAGGSMIFIMPGLFTIGSLPKDERNLRAMAAPVGMIALGVAVAVMGFSLEMKKIVDDYF